MGSARVGRRLRRNDSDCATGLDLPAPGGGGDYYFEGPAPPALDPGDLFDALVEELQRIMQTHPVVYLASDGSEDKSVGAFALAPGNFVCSAGNGDEDQTPYKQKLLGFHVAATAVAEAASRSTWQGRAVFALDCKAALRTPTSAVARDKYPGLASEIRAALTHASRWECNSVSFECLLMASARLGKPLQACAVSSFVY